VSNSAAFLSQSYPNYLNCGKFEPFHKPKGQRTAQPIALIYKNFQRSSDTFSSSAARGFFGATV
jgi:hypothetical protein